MKSNLTALEEPVRLGIPVICARAQVFKELRECGWAAHGIESGLS